MLSLVRASAYALLIVTSLTACEKQIQVVSPNGDIKLEVDVSSGGHATYTLTAGDELLVRPSDLGLILKDSVGFMWNMQLSDVSYSAHDSEWELPWGERRVVRENYREMLLRLENSDNDELFVRFRVFDDGVGFRYEIPNPQQRTIQILEEITEINVANNSTAFWQPFNGKIRYEHLYRETPLSEMEAAHTPVTLRLPTGTHISIHEAALHDFAAFSLVPKSDGDTVLSLRTSSDGVAVRTNADLKSSWRSIQISDNAVGLINSDLILNLNEPNQLGDVSWVNPGKYAGIWWAIHLGQQTWHAGPNHGATTEEARRYVDFAAKHGFEGVLIEGWNVGWGGEGISFTDAYPDFDLTAVTDYARSKGVHIIGHHETYGDVPAYENALEEALDLYAAAGVPQVKTGYVAEAGKLRRRGDDGEAVNEWHDSQYAVQHHVRVLQEAAKRKISINTHEPVKDTGLRRTYPNWLTREGSRGQEFAIWGETPNPPNHTVLLAYTRMLGGPMDFTPGIFNLHPKGSDSPHRIQTTLAKQLALYVVLYSPIQMVPDLFENYEARPDAFQFIVDVPTDWEESIALAGEVGDYVVIARKERGGDDWYLGAITDEEARTFDVPLTFLDAGKPYMAEIYRDSEDAHWDSNPYGIEIDARTLNSENTLELRLAAGGGAAIRFRPYEEAAE